jgi:hypothetical protein
MIYSFDSEHDLSEVRKIWERFYKDEFAFPDFVNGYIALFKTETSSGQIIAVGGIRTVVEMVAITDQSLSPFVRKRSYYELLTACSHVARHLKYDSVHVFAQGDKWTNTLERIGFKPCKGSALFLGI